MTATFTVVAAKGTKVTVYNNGLGKLPALLVIKNAETKSSNGSVEAEDDAGRGYIGPALGPGQAVAITVPATVSSLQLFNLNDVLRAEVQIMAV